MFTFDKPKVYKKDWYVFPNAVLSNIDLSDCNNTINGTCHSTSSLSKCIDICRADKSCLNGYYIKTPDNKNICAPLLDRGVSPYFRLRNKKYYPVMKNMKPYFFSKKTYPFPPEEPNTIYFTDHFLIKNLDTNKIMGKENENFVAFQNDGKILQFLPSDITNDFIENYIPVNNGSEVTVNIPFSANVLRYNDMTTEMQWQPRASTYFVPNNTLQIYSNSKKNIGQALNYSDTFYFTFQGKDIYYDTELERLTTSTSKKTLFQLVPQVEVYYCERNHCRQITLDQTNMNGFYASYKGFPVYRSPVCWNTCKKDWYVRYYLFFLVLILLLFFFIRARHHS